MLQESDAVVEDWGRLQLFSEDSHFPETDMEKPGLAHVLQPGQQLYCRWREAGGQVLQNLQKMRLTPDGGNHDPMIHVTFVDAQGTSLYIARGYTYGGDMEAFLPRSEVMIQSYFGPLSVFNESYARRAHYSRKFPLDFL